MKIKFVYALISSEEDIYLEQVFISMNSLRYHNPNAYIELVIDTKTQQSLNGVRAKEAAFADKLTIINLDKNLKAQQRSRILKTGLRNYVNGDFLFIDSDTIILKDLSSIDDYQYPIGAVWDTHTKLCDNPYKEKCYRHVKKIGSLLNNEDYYFNSGVMLVRDTPQTHDFYNDWASNYLNGYKNHVSMDQPSLAKTNIEKGHIIRRLPDTWNCQFKHGIRYLRDAYILHYLTTNKNNGGSPPFLLNDINLVKQIKETGIIPSDILELFDNPFNGIAPVVHLFSGDDIYFFRTNLFKFISSLYSHKSILYKLLAFFPDLLCYLNENFDFKYRLKKVGRTFSR